MEKCVGFLRQLFERWREANVAHCVSLLFFSRTYYPQLTGADPTAVTAASQAASDDSDSHSPTPSSPSGIMHDSKTGVFYRDFYRVVTFEEHAVDTQLLLLRVKRAFVEYGRHIDCRNDPAATQATSSAHPVALSRLTVHCASC